MSDDSLSRWRERYSEELRAVANSGGSPPPGWDGVPVSREVLHHALDCADALAAELAAARERTEELLELLGEGEHALTNVMIFGKGHLPDGFLASIEYCRDRLRRATLPPPPAGGES